jgi:RNA polymerase sigma-70 factor (ECF subfamily)
MEISIDQKMDDGEQEQARLDVADKTPNIESRLLAQDRASVIRNAVESLPEKQRAAVLLHKYVELDYAEIARTLECSESALKSLLFRAYETLRVQLAPMMSGGGLYGTENGADAS